MVDKKGTGWIPDYPDIRDYHIGEIEQKLRPKVQDVEITDDFQGTLEKLVSLLKNSLNKSSEPEGVKNPNSIDFNSEINEIEKTIRGNFKLVNAQVLTEESFVSFGNVSDEVYELQQKFLTFYTNCHAYFQDSEIKYSKNQKNEIILLKTCLQELENVSKIDPLDPDQVIYNEYGYFGEVTKSVVYQFKKTFDLSNDFIVDKITFYTLNQILEILEILQNPETTESVSSNKDTNTTFKLGQFNKEKIKDIQIKLNKIGYLEALGEYKGPITGCFDKLTEEAVKKFQKQKGLLENGRVDKKTSDALDEDYNETHRLADSEDIEKFSFTVPLEMGSRGQSVKNVQSMLSQLEEFNGQITEYFGALTERSVKYFQSRHGLIANGKVDEQTWIRLIDLVKLKNKQRKPQRVVFTASSPIPIKLYEIFLSIFKISEFEAKDFFSEKQSQNKTEPDDQKHLNELRRTIDLIVTLIAQIISPLAQHNNLEKAVKDVLEKLDKWFENSDYINCPPEQHNQEQNSKSKTSSEQLINAEDIKSMIESAIWNLQNQSASINYPRLQKAEAEIDLFKEWHLSPLALPLAISTILNFRKALANVRKSRNNSPENNKIPQTLDQTLDVNNIFKSINIIVNRENKKNNIKLQVNNNSQISSNYLRTIQILTDIDNTNTEFVTSDLQVPDLQVPIEWNLEEKIRTSKDNIQTQNGKETEETAHLSYLLMPEFVDLSFWCSPVEDQGSLNACTAYAGIALKEYFENRRFDRFIDASPRFLYKVTRNLMLRQGDTGASLRETMKAMALFGVPPEEYCPYEEENYDNEPTPFCYSFAQSYQALKYFRLNSAGTSGEILLLRVKTVLAAGFPCAFGFTMYNSIDDDSNPKGHIPYPLQKDKVKGGHAVVAVGYDDYKIIQDADGKPSRGALLIRNSWGINWGQRGYGWLPYEYVLTGLTADWWSLLKSEWFETRNFGLGANEWGSLGGPGTHNQPKKPKKPKEPRI
jgi:C1A family cysteine protease/peptidoglycan hydrolase-like protein with peptidoglycan-binding domain